MRVALCLGGAVLLNESSFTGPDGLSTYSADNSLRRLEPEFRLLAKTGPEAPKDLAIEITRLVESETLLAQIRGNVQLGRSYCQGINRTRFARDSWMSMTH